MSAAAKTRAAIGILLVDDHAVIRSALRMLIDNHPNLVAVGEARNSKEALELAEREQPEVILLDLCLGDENGIDLIPQLLTIADASKIIVLTGVQDEEMHRSAIREGAMGVVSKEASAEFLLKAIDRVHAGELWLNRQSTASLVSELRRERAPRDMQPEPEIPSPLTDRELEVLSLVGEGLKNRQIADRLCISEATVRHHLTAILRKVGASDRVELLIYAYRNNLVSVRK